LNKEENFNAEACYIAFVNYKNEQYQFFTNNLKCLILKTNDKVILHQQLYNL
jgi:hypothetical protein